MRYRRGLLGKRIVWTLCLSCLVNAAIAQQPYKVCRAAKVLSLQTIYEDRIDSSPASIGEQLSVTPTAMQGGKENRQLGFSILGPVLGSMDARDIATDLQCTARGLTLTITSQRSAEYVGAVHKNIPWRAKVRVVLFPNQPSVFFKTEWTMKLPDGTPVMTAQTPPYPAVTYPLTATLVLP